MSDGDNLILGTNNDAQSQTDLRRTGGGDESPGAYGLHVEFLDGHAIGGHSALGFGLEGISFGASGVKGTSTNGDGVGGTSSTAVGVAGGSTQSSGVRGTSFQGFGVEGFCFGTQIGVQGTCHNHIGVRGDSDSAWRRKAPLGAGLRTPMRDVDRAHNALSDARRGRKCFVQRERKKGRSVALAPGRSQSLSCFRCSGSLSVDPLTAVGIFPRARAVFERLAPFVIRKLALSR